MTSRAIDIDLNEREPATLKDITRSFPKRKDLHRDRGWKGVVETLSKEHEGLFSLLEVLEKETEKLKPKKVPDYHLIEDIINYLKYYPEEYHHNRENLLFDRVLDQDADISALNRLIREHRELSGQSLIILDKISNITKGSAADRPELLKEISEYIHLYRKHMKFESESIFPLAKGKFSNAAWASIEANSRYIDDPLFGEDIHYRYRRLAITLKGEIDDLTSIYTSDDKSCIESIVSGFNKLITMPYRIARAMSPFRQR